MSSQSLVNSDYDRSLETTLDQALHVYNDNRELIGLRRQSNGNSLLGMSLGAAGQNVNRQESERQPVGNAHSPTRLDATAIANATIHSTMGRSADKHRIKKPGQRYGAKKKSWVWNWFIQNQDDSNSATCEHCSKIIKRLPSDKGSPKKLGEHLRTHKITKDTISPRSANFVNLSSMSSTADHVASDASNGLDSTPGAVSTTPLSTSRLNIVSTVTGDSFIDTREFDNAGYSQMKFHKDIMKFLTDNKLPINVVKTHSFRQLIFTLRPESILDLNELNHIYSSLIQVIKNESPTAPEISDQQVQPSQLQRTPSRAGHANNTPDGNSHIQDSSWI